MGVAIISSSFFYFIVSTQSPVESSLWVQKSSGNNFSTAVPDIYSCCILPDIVFRRLFPRFNLVILSWPLCSIAFVVVIGWYQSVFFVPSSLSSFPPSPSPSGTLSSSCFPLRLFIARAIVAATAALKNDPSFFFSRPPDRLTPTSIVASVADFGPTIPYCGLAPSPHHHLIPSNDWHPVHALLDAASQISSKSSATGVWFGSFTSLRSSVNRKLTYGPLSPGCFVQSVSRPLRRPEMADVMKR